MITSSFIYHIVFQNPISGLFDGTAIQSLIELCGRFVGNTVILFCRYFSFVTQLIRTGVYSFYRIEVFQPHLNAKHYDLLRRIPKVLGPLRSHFDRCIAGNLQTVSVIILITISILMIKHDYARVPTRIITTLTLVTGDYFTIRKSNVPSFRKDYFSLWRTITFTSKMLRQPSRYSSDPGSSRLRTS